MWCCSGIGGSALSGGGRALSGGGRALSDCGRALSGCGGNKTPPSHGVAVGVMPVVLQW